ncbi:unnamed protein product [Blumeria hordei]|uniref:Uncharacterized protein n=1 Tax=Blumeria hordei TaxID=2867405 RepID=A0A383ULH7_BLUHO|nr:unnamed protein product [Blumeria hordei]
MIKDSFKSTDGCSRRNANFSTFSFPKLGDDKIHAAQNFHSRLTAGLSSKMQHLFGAIISAIFLTCVPAQSTSLSTSPGRFREDAVVGGEDVVFVEGVQFVRKPRLDSLPQQVAT